MSASEDHYLLLWKGRESGPFNLEQIREKLVKGEISRIHQIKANGGWQLLDEFLDKNRQVDLEAQRAEEQRLREAELKRTFEVQLAEERARHVYEPPRPTQQLSQQSGQPSLSHLLPPESEPLPPPSFTPTLGAPPGPNSFGAPPPPFPEAHARTSGFAVTALVMGLCNFIPFVNFISWILALAFGHIALSQIKHDASLKGRGMAIAGLVITYFLLLMGLTFVVLSVSNHRKLSLPF